MIKINKIFGDVIEIEPFIHKDERGFFYEKFNLKRYQDLGLKGPWVQDNEVIFVGNFAVDYYYLKYKLKTGLWSVFQIKCLIKRVLYLRQNSLCLYSFN